MTEYTFVVTRLSKKEWTVTTRSNSLAEAEASVLLETHAEGPPRGAVETLCNDEVMVVDRIPFHLS